MKIKEYTTELDVDKKNVLREVGHYVIVKVFNFHFTIHNWLPFRNSFCDK